MKKEIIDVPKEVRYISEWNDFPLQQLSTGHCIVNKTITGCGYTHYCLTNNQNVILCSPRKFLLENKFKQIEGLYLVVNNGEKGIGIDSESNKKKEKSLSKNQNDFDIILELEKDLSSYILNHSMLKKPKKILVTYDSLKYVLKTLGEDINNYSIIVDEFQNIFMDASFKADTELNFVRVLQDCPNVTYLSATPYIEEYLEELDEFKDLPYYELKWDPSRLRTINIDFKKTSTINKEIDKIVNRYLSGNFPVKVDGEKNLYESKEVVFYVNSVRMIKSIIKRNNLSPDQVNIICARTKSNEESLLSLGLTIGTSPLYGEPHKMFTFCTRTTYAGADFYSSNAISVVVSDCKIDSLSTDIRMDFPQIMGRQRLLENKFRDDCIFIFSLSDSSLTMEQFNEIKERKFEFTNRDIKNFELLRASGYCENNLLDLRNRINTFKYKNDYTGIDEKIGCPVINKLVMLSEKRAFEIRSNVYKTEVQVYNEFNEVEDLISLEQKNKIMELVNNSKQEYMSSQVFTERLKIICLLLKDPIVRGYISLSDLSWVSRDHRNYINYLGVDRIRALSYVEADIKREISLLKRGSQLKELIVSAFIIGEKYSLKDIKERLRDLYISNDFSKTPKATDILEYFEVRECLVTDKETKKRNKGYEILSLKE